MKKIEELLNIDMGRKFDTPKKLNRSTREVPQGIIDALEAGDFTSEQLQMFVSSTGSDQTSLPIDGYANKLPLFYYRTCITLHGSWPEISRTRIGGYKNVIQNQNGSVEIRWSAIDAKKVHEIVRTLRKIDSPWGYSENSSTRAFYIQKPITAQNFEQVRAELEPLAKKAVELPIYGYVNLYRAQTPWGAQYLVLQVTPLAIHTDDVERVTLFFAGMSYQEVQQKIAEHDAQEIERRRELNDQLRKEQEQNREKRAKYEKAIAEVYAPQLAKFPLCDDVKRGILVRLNNSVPGFVFYRFDGNGAFGRIKVSKALADTLTAELTWKPLKQTTEDEVRKVFCKNQTRLMNAASKPEPVKEPSKPAPAPTGERKVLMTIAY